MSFSHHPILILDSIFDVCYSFCTTFLPQQRFLSDANTKVPTQYKQPFTDAMKKLFRSMKETSTPQEEIDAVRFYFVFVHFLVLTSQHVSLSLDIYC